MNCSALAVEKKCEAQSRRESFQLSNLKFPILSSANSLQKFNANFHFKVGKSREQTYANSNILKFDYLHLPFNIRNIKKF